MKKIHTFPNFVPNVIEHEESVHILSTLKGLREILEIKQNGNNGNMPLQESKDMLDIFQGGYNKIRYETNEKFQDNEIEIIILTFKLYIKLIENNLNITEEFDSYIFKLANRVNEEDINSDLLLMRKWFKILYPAWECKIDIESLIIAGSSNLFIPTVGILKITVYKNETVKYVCDGITTNNINELINTIIGCGERHNDNIFGIVTNINNIVNSIKLQNKINGDIIKC